MSQLPSRLAAALVALFLWSAAPAFADLDVVFVLDTTGSMSAEIREVQERVVDLADSLAQAREGERIRFGVVAYRDRGDVYVTKVSPLAESVETTRSFLSSLAAEGGGDGPESVIAALVAALGDMAWDPAEGTDRQVFLIGDAPPHLDYAGEATPGDVIAAARRQRIVVNTIGCRSLPPLGVAFFRRIAYSTEGSYQHIGRVRRAEKGALAAAVSRAAGAFDGRAKPGEPVPLTWARHEDGRFASILVRQGGPEGTAQDPLGDSLPRCTLEVLLPEGLALAGDPSATLGPRGLEVKLPLAKGTGGRELYGLERCPSLSTPIHVSLGGL